MRFLNLFLFLICILEVSAQAPKNYYAFAKNTKGAKLKTSLHMIIRDHKQLSYGELWRAYKVTDDHLNDNGTETILWDMYSDNPNGEEVEFTFIEEQCGSYKREGDCYNREHSFPKSWWGGSKGTPMFTDLFHVIPTDGYINSKRGNWPLGEVKRGNEKFISKNGSRLGKSVVKIKGYNGYVFEPIDAYKGDIARSYFYMATRYEDKIATWEHNSPNADIVLNGSEYTVYEPWFLNLMIKWHKQDPVSQKEIDKNNDIYQKFQGNRNPFIDHPNLVDCIWKNDCSANPFLKETTEWLRLVTKEQNIYLVNNLEQKEILIELTDHQGQPIIDCTSKGTELIDASYLPKGKYHLTIVAEDDTMLEKTITVD